MNPKTTFLCSKCETALPKWHGRCPSCDEWGTVLETAAPVAASRLRSGRPGRSVGTLESATPLPITEVKTDRETRVASGFEEVDRVLGGGLVAGSTVLVGGEPGIGKSTLMTMLGHRLAAAGRKVLYVTGEESAAQVRLRADRLEALDERLLLLAETDLETIAAHAETLAPAVCILDSIQTIDCPRLGGSPGTVTQVREAAHRLVRIAKARDMALFLIGHVTKDGTLAGPRTLEHLVDVVLAFEGDRHHAFRLLRGVKNRFGAAGEVAVFEMGARGLAQVTNPSMLLLRGRSRNEPGSVVAPVIIGTRPFLVEVQALTVPAPQGNPRRVVTGLDPRRAQLVLAILERRCGFDLAARDVYLNVVGGIRVDEPAVDVGLALALASAYTERAVPPDWVAIGELGLMGEVRAVPRLDGRLAEAARLGFTRALLPADAEKGVKGRTPSLEVRAAATLAQALEVVGVVA
jgi:DNA repair protein RadA/Sms